MIEIGNWVRREKSGAKWHLVESVIDDEAITRCGRRMEQASALNDLEALDVSDVMPLTRMIGQPQLCKFCAGPQ